MHRFHHPLHRSAPALRADRPWIVLPVLAALLCFLGPGAESAAAQPPDRAQKASIEAFADRSSYAPGETARIAVRATVEDNWHLQAHIPTYDYLIPTVLRIELAEPRDGIGIGDVAYPDPIQWRAPFAGDEILDVYEGETTFFATVQVGPRTPAGSLPLELILDYQACDDRVCLRPTSTSTTLELTVGEPGEPTHTAVFVQETSGTAASGAAAPGPGLLTMIGLAVLGGLILNLMPCVLPVLSIKVFGLLQAAEEGRGSVRRGALAFSAGVFVSFWILAGLAIGLRAAGEAVGWGIQFQNPVFVAFLTVVMVFFALNLWGLFEIPLPRFLGRGGGHGNAGHFGGGLLATLMATPCSAPFLGTAIGFALSREPMTILIIFTAIGFGLALPNLVLAISPRAAALLPRPGAWMETLRGVFGFLLAATAVWLLYVLNGQVSSATLALVQAALLGIGLFAYLGRSQRTGAVARLVPLVGMLVCAAGALWIAGTSAPEARANATSDYDWVEFDEGQALEFAQSGRLVFVDVTADWCATCKVNERVVLANQDVQAAFRTHDVVMMKADWTNRNDVIADYLAAFGRYAIPFYVLYRPGQEPHVFGELLSKGSVIGALQDSTNVTVADTPGN